MDAVTGAVVSNTNTILTAMDIYWVLMLPKLGTWFCVLALLLMCVAAILMVYYNDDRGEHKSERTWAKVWAWILVIQWNWN